ncbi:MAG: hypothetical protein FJZ92_04710 [Chloroflexi bacterium]|nr:hypothetical protein [Chloroflexota bacterium]
MVPLAASVFVASSIFLAPWGRGTAAVLAVALLTFNAYWLLRSYSVAVAAVVGLRRLRAWQRIDWPRRYAVWRSPRPLSHEWDWPRHMVIIPNYRESLAGLARTLDSLAAQANAEQLVVVLAMEAREAEARTKAAALRLRFRGRFAKLFATFHPSDIPGETPGKGSNEAWAARQAYTRLILGEDDDINRYTVTSCDADAVFHPRHFEALNYLFLTSRDRYHAFWQPAIFNSNNIWDVPAPLRIPDGLSGINRLANLVLPTSVKMPTSCYSLSWILLHEVDYWDEEVIPEDWHLYLKCCYTVGDRVHVEPLFLPLGNDCVHTDGYWKTLRAHYFQAVRHAWGASDIPYAWRAATSRRTRLRRARGLMLAANLTKVHVLWASQWFVVTFGVIVPARFAGVLDAPMPYWWTHRAFHLPGVTWHLEHIASPSTWLAFDRSGLVEPMMWMNLSGFLVALCLLPLIAIIVVEAKSRGTRPPYVSRVGAIGQFAMWPLMAVITFFWAALPAFHAQWRLASGRGLVYRVAEKGGRDLKPVIELDRPLTAPLPAD